jgi:tetratricopeptide (TPR) repeat protein
MRQPKFLPESGPLSLPLSLLRLPTILVMPCAFVLRVSGVLAQETKLKGIDAPSQIQRSHDKSAATLDNLPAADPTTSAGQRRRNVIAKLIGRTSDPRAWVEMGDQLAQESREAAGEALYQPAQVCYEKALALNEKYLPAMIGQAWALGAQHLFKESLNAAKLALTLDPNAAAAHGIIGDAQLELGRYDEALDAYQRMIDLKPDISSWSRGAYALWITGNKSKGQWLMDRAIKAGAPFSENTQWCRVRLAMMQLRDGLPMVAWQTLATALTDAEGQERPLDKVPAPVLVMAARVKMALQDTKSATTYLDHLIEKRATHEALAHRAEIASFEKDETTLHTVLRRVAALDRVHQQSKGHGHLAAARTLIEHDGGSRLEALSLAERYIDTQNVLEADTVAWIYHMSGESAKAVTAMKKALSQNTPDPEIHFHAGMIAEKAGDRHSAQRHFQKALSLNPRFSLIYAPEAQRRLDALASTDRPQSAQSSKGAKGNQAARY